MNETKPLLTWLREDSEKWDDKNEDSRVPIHGDPDYTYGYNAGCVEAFRASAVRVEQFAATHLAPQAEPSEEDTADAEQYYGGSPFVRAVYREAKLAGRNAERARIFALLVGKGEK